MLNALPLPIQADKCSVDLFSEKLDPIKAWYLPLNYCISLFQYCTL